MWKNNIEKQNTFNEQIMPLMDALFNMALKLTYNQEEAKDLVQEAYYKAYKYFGQFIPGTSIKAWMFSILRNTFINNYRKKSRQPLQVDYDDVEPYIQDLKSDTAYGFGSTSHIDSILRDSLDDEVSEALSQLSEDFRMVLLLSDIEGFSYKEIAQIINIPIGTVRSRLFRARKALFNELSDYAKAKGYMPEAQETVLAKVG